MQSPPDDMAPVRLSVIAPAHDEEANVAPLVSELEAALHDLPGGFEAIIVDDGSNDDTRRRLREEASSREWLRVLAMEDTPPGRGNGQSAAFKAGIGASRGALIALLDADLQNDPADLPGMVRLLEERDADFVQGDRSANRRDTVVRRGLLLGGTVRPQADPRGHHPRYRLLAEGDEAGDRRGTAPGVPRHAPLHPGDRPAAGLHGDRDASPASPPGRRRGEVRGLEPGDPRTGRLLRGALDAGTATPDRCQ